MMKKIFLFLFLVTLLSQSAVGDGGFLPFIPVKLEESAQNAIVAWNGKEEVLILSIDLKSSQSVNVLRILPLPSNPEKIKEASMDSFKNFIEIYNEKAKMMHEKKEKVWEGGRMASAAIGYKSIVITFSANEGHII